MNKLIPSKYAIFSFAAAFFVGCVLMADKIISMLTLLPVLVFLCLLMFINRHNKKWFILPLLAITALLGSFMYHQSEARPSSLAAMIGTTETIEGIVAEDPLETEYGYRVLLKKVYYYKGSRMFQCNERVFAYLSKENKVVFGDKIRVEARLESVAKLRNFGDFDFVKYYQSKAIYVKAFPVTVNRIASNKGGLTATFLHNCNVKVKNTIFSAMPHEEAALLYGILTGSKADIDPEVMQVFSLTGLAHILSVSGLHIGFLVLLLNFILRPFKLEKKISSAVIFAAVFFYVMLIGAPVPAVRSLLMLAVLLVGTSMGQKYDLNASASFAALLMLLWNPLLVHDPSFIITFACIYAISFLHQPINRALNFLPSLIRSSTALSVAVWIGITPVLIHYFNYVSVVNILLNILAVPIAFLITLGGFVAVVIGLISQALSIYVFAISYYLIKLLYLLSEKALLLPLAGFQAPAIKWYVYILYYSWVLMLVQDFWSTRSYVFKKRYISTIAVSIAAIIAISILPTSTLKIYFVDVGQGDCSLIQMPDKRTIMIDGGGSPDWQKSSYDIGEKVTVPALLHLGVWRIDTLMISHIHDDHLAGALSVLDKFKVRRVILPASDRYGEGEFASENYERLKALCKQRKIPILYLKAGSVIKADRDVKISVLAPKEPYIKSTESDVNNNSLVFKLEYKDFDALFTGDIQTEGEQRLKGEVIKAEVLKVAHHGSPYSCTPTFLEQTKPAVSIISVGKNNYGHPSIEVIERLKSMHSAVYRTDGCGAVMLTTDGKKLHIKTIR